MKKFQIILSAVIMLVFVFGAIQTFAHAGGTDANGGHIDYDTGEYHYHHGYPAHQHINGECPYNFDDNVRSVSRTGGSSSSYKTHGRNIRTEDIFMPMYIYEYSPYRLYEEKSKAVYIVCGFCSLCSVFWLAIQFIDWRDEHGNKES